MSATFITSFDSTGPGPRVAVKDLIDMAGVPTTAGSRVLAETAVPAAADAACLAGLRVAGARVVGKTNLHELALGVTGINPWFGTPENPLDPSLAPGGSSSGSAVAVATGEADVAYGTDTGGSIRIPAACCGICGLKTTWGRIPLDGVRPLTPSMDTVGPMAADVAGLILGMQLLEPGFAVAAGAGSPRVGRVRVPAAPDIDDAVTAALRATSWDVTDLDPAEWRAATKATGPLLVNEAYQTNKDILERDADRISPDVAARLDTGRQITPARTRGAQRGQAAVAGTTRGALRPLRSAGHAGADDPAAAAGPGDRPAGVALHAAGQPRRGTCAGAAGPGPWPAAGKHPAGLGARHRGTPAGGRCGGRGRGRGVSPSGRPTHPVT